jgi:hypothetical protein
LFVSLLILASAPLALSLPAVHGDLHERLARVEALLLEEPDAPRLLLRRAALHREHGDWPAAAVDLARAAKLDPSLDGLDLEAALLAAASGRVVAGPGMRAVGPPPGATIAAASVPVVAPGTTWKYKDDGNTPPSSWRHPGFNDSTWLSGGAELGYGDGDEATVVSFGPNASQKYPTTWFRHVFQGPAALPPDLSVSLLCDDGAIVYLKDTEVARFNLPASGVSSSTWALSNLTGAEETLWRWYAVDPQVLTTGTNVLAVEVHQAAPTSTDLSFDIAVIPEPPPRLARGPWLQAVSTDAATVSWRSLEPWDSEVRWGTSPGQLSNVVTVPGFRYDHEVRITGLPTDSTVYYSVGNSAEVFAGDDPEHRFVTAPSPDKRRLRAWVLGDSGLAGADQQAVRDAYLALEQTEGEADFLMLLGDNAYPDGGEADYQAGFFEPFGDILRRLPVWSTIGNHDAPNIGVYSGIFAPPIAGECGGLPSGNEGYYSWDWGDVHFVCLDSVLPSRQQNAPMATWLEQDLNASDARFTIAYFHHPPYTKGSHNSDNIYDSGGRMKEMRENLLPILEAGGVDLVLSGHSHSYERSHLLHGHYGFSWQLLSAQVRQVGWGQPVGDRAYRNTTLGGSGTMYVVSGGSSKIAPGSFNHPAMAVGGEWLGSLILEVDGDRLDLRFLDGNGVVGDRVSLVTADPPPVVWTSPLQAGASASLQVRQGVPGAAFYVWSGSAAGRAQLPQGTSGLAPPVTLLFSGVFGPNGVFHATATLPAAMSGRTVALQAAQQIAPGDFLFGPVLFAPVQ